MHGKGGPTINESTARVMRFTSFTIPFIILAYSLLIKFGLVYSANYVNDLVLYLIIGPWVFNAVYHFIRPPKSKGSTILHFTSYHLLSFMSIIFVTGFSTPFVTMWVLLMMASYVQLGKMGTKVSVLSILIICFIDILMHLNNSGLVLTNILTTVATLFIGMTAIAISKVQEVDGAELTRSKELEDLQKSRILAIVNNLTDAVLSTDKDGVIRVYNAASLSLLDTNMSPNGHSIDEILELYDQNENKIDLYRTIKKIRNVEKRDDLTMNVSGESYRIELTCSPIKSNYSQDNLTGNSAGYILILRDITKSKSLEEERDEFISVVSHELRTPITIAEGTVSNVQVMIDRPDMSHDMIKNGIQSAHDQILYLSKIVNDLGTLSRAERSVSDNLEPVDIRKLIDELYNEYNIQAEAKGLHFNLDQGSYLGSITTNRLYLKEILQNLITNSIKYTKKGSITIKAYRNDKSVTFEIVDTGIGISKNDQAKIFNKFYRSEDYRTRETSGTGLGLYVASKLAKKINTKIELYSRLNHGSSFKFTLFLEQTNEDSKS